MLTNGFLALRLENDSGQSPLHDVYDIRANLVRLGKLGSWQEAVWLPNQSRTTLSKTR
jgi:hypothetical protein